MDPAKRLERSVDSLQKIYTVIVGLAIAQAVQALSVADRATNTLANWSDLQGRLPAFLAFAVVLVPFFHGMNRHLDYSYLERPEGEQAQGALLFDFVVFFAQSAILFLIATSIAQKTLAPFVFLAALLALDVIWSLVSHWIHYRTLKASIVRWSIINAVTLALGLALALPTIYEDAAKAWLLLVLAVARTLADYKACWSFYFPPIAKSA